MFIMVQHYFAYPILDRHNRALEAAFFPAFGGATLALHCKIVDILPGVAVERCDHISAYALRRIMIGKGDLRIGSPRAAVIAHHGPAHRFNAAADAGVDHACSDLGGKQIDRIKTRRTDRKSTRLNSSHSCASRMPSSA